jgi:hypothetical protein
LRYFETNAGDRDISVLAPDVHDAATPLDAGESPSAGALLKRRAWQEFPPIRSFRREPFLACVWIVRAVVASICLAASFSLAASIPVVNVFALGYLVEAQGRVCRSGKIRSAFYLLPAVQRLSGIVLAVWLWLLPVQFLAQAARDSWLLAPAGKAAWILTGSLVATSLAVACHLLLAIGCGGGWWRFFRPISNLRRFSERLRSGSYWHVAHESICEFVGAFRLPHLFRLGLLAYVAVYFWLSLPTLLFTSLEDVTSRWQVVAFVIGCIGLALSLIWLPILLAHVAAIGRWKAILEVSRVRDLYAATPLRWTLANALVLASSCLPLLYTALFKIRIPPHAARWDLMLLFLVTAAPARILIGWVYYRSAKRTPRSPTWAKRIWQAISAAPLLVGVCYYVYFLNLAATGGELGDRSVWQFHALLLPFPF